MKGCEALKQVMLKRERISTLEAEGFERERNVYKCGICGVSGHSIISCQEPCSVEGCDAAVCPCTTQTKR